MKALKLGIEFLLSETSLPQYFSPADLFLCTSDAQRWLLCKLSEQQGLLALMEVKVKEMEGSIHHLHLTEVRRTS